MIIKANLQPSGVLVCAMHYVVGGVPAKSSEISSNSADPLAELRQMEQVAGARVELSGVLTTAEQAYAAKCGWTLV